MAYVRSVKLGAYMWRNRLHSVTRGLKWAIFKAFGTLEGPKKAPMGLGMGSCHLFVRLNRSRITFEKTLF